MFSVIIPLYNKEKYITRTLQSVLKQTLQDFEIIIINDGSTDKSVYEARKFDDNRIRIIEQQNAGLAAARNRGIKEAKYSLIAFLDADDEWYENFLEIIASLTLKYPNAGLYATSYSVIDKNNKENITPIDKNLIYGDAIIDYFKMSFFCKYLFIPSSVCIRKSTFSEVGLFLDVIGEDYEMFQRVALDCDIAFSSQICVKYYAAIENSLSKYKKYKKPKFIEILNKLVSSKNIEESKIFYIKEYTAKVNLNIAKDMILTGDNTEARKLLLGCDTKLLKRYKYILLLLTLLPSSIVLITRNILRNWLYEKNKY